MHVLAEMAQVTRKEFLRGLQGLSDEDARKRVGPMNCISWIIGHVAHQQHAFFAAWPRGSEEDPRYRVFGTGSAPSQPPLEDAMALWRESCEAADAWLGSATEDGMKAHYAPRWLVERGGDENAGTLISRHIFHTWSHIGEISAIRQMLGHRAPEFVNLHGWSYG